MRKCLLWGLVLGLLVVLGGCTDNGTTDGPTGHLSAQNPVTVTLWHYYVGENQQALERAVSDFNQTLGIAQGVIVDAVGMGSIAELEESITRSAMGILNAEPMPQIFSSYPDKALEIDALDMLVDLNDYFTDAEKEAYVADFLEDGIFDGDRLLLLPVVKSTELLYLNETAWSAFAGDQGIGTDSLGTWEGLYDTARAYYAWTAGEEEPWSGTSFMGFDSVANLILIGARQLGVQVIEAGEGGSGQAVLDLPVLRRVFDLYAGGYSLGYFDAIGRFRSDDIKAGDLIAYVGSSSSAAYFPTWIEQDNQQQPIRFMALPYPVLTGGEAYAIQQGAGMCVAKSTPAQQEGAALFLKWFTDVEENIAFAMTTGYLPVKETAFASEGFEKALSDLRGGDQIAQNVAAVYEISLHQITQSNTYSAPPFTGSYDLRQTLQSTLMQSGEEAREAAQPHKAAGASEAEILQALDLPARFEAWIDSLREELEVLGIAYTEKR